LTFKLVPLSQLIEDLTIISGSQLWTILCLPSLQGIFANVWKYFVLGEGDCYQHLVGEAREASKHPIVLDPIDPKKIIWSKMSIVPG
jgi:hypothetical protein